MATGDDVNHRCGRTSEVFLDKVGVICLVSKIVEVLKVLKIEYHDSVVGSDRGQIRWSDIRSTFVAQSQFVLIRCL